MRMFEKLRDNLEDFTEEEREDILRWSEEVAKPRRERKGVNRYADNKKSSSALSTSSYPPISSKRK